MALESSLSCHGPLRLKHGDPPERWAPCLHRPNEDLGGLCDPLTLKQDLGSTSYNITIWNSVDYLFLCPTRNSVPSGAAGGRRGCGLGLFSFCLGYQDHLGLSVFWSSGMEQITTHHSCFYPKCHPSTPSSSQVCLSLSLVKCSV